MAVARFETAEFYRGLSSDTKPTSPDNMHPLFYETDTGRWYIHNGSAWVAYSGPAAGPSAQAEAQFLSQVFTILGDTRLLWTPDGSDTTTSIDKSLNGRTITWDASVASRLSALGLGYAQSFNGTSQFGTAPDAANLSFNGVTDVAMSIIALVNVTNTAAIRQILTKRAASNNEYEFYVTTADQIELSLYDQSAAAAQETSRSTAAVTQGAWRLFATTYSAAVGGTSASADITIYVDGLLVAMTLQDSGTYVAMDGGTSAVAIGATSAGVSPFSGSMAFVALAQKNLSASEHWNLSQLIRGYFGV